MIPRLVLRLSRYPAAVPMSLLATLLVASLAVPAAAHSPDPILGGGLFDANETLKFRWADGGTPPAAMRTAIVAAADDANTSRASKAPLFAYSATGASAVYYGVDVPCGVNGIACMRRSAPDTFGVWFRENGRRFDWGILRWCELSGSPDGCFEVENVMLDELGHVMVLAHHVNFADDSDFGDAVVQTVSRSKPKSGWNAHRFGRCDVATLQQQYDVPDWTTAYSTCLDVPTVITLVPSRTSLMAGGMVTFTATLESDGTGRLSNNPIASRTVVLQHRTPSGWADVAVMSPGSQAGTYVTALTLWAGRDYRALFRKPSGEGLRGSSSPAVTIVVTPRCTISYCSVVTPKD